MYILSYFLYINAILRSKISNDFVHSYVCIFGWNRRYFLEIETQTELISLGNEPQETIIIAFPTPQSVALWVETHTGNNHEVNGVKLCENSSCGFHDMESPAFLQTLWPFIASDFKFVR